MSDEGNRAGRPVETSASRPLAPTGLDRAAHLAFVAHELRNPLSTAAWCAELLARLSPEERGGERGLKLASLEARALGRLQVLVEDHLLCERLDAGGYPLHLAPVALAPVVAAAVERLGLATPPEVHLAEDLACHADRSLFERAVEAVMAAAGRGSALVRVTGARERGVVRLAVQGGPLERIEDPVKGTPSDPAGRALSLPMARRVAQVHGGALTAEGEGYLLVFPAA